MHYQYRENTGGLVGSMEDAGEHIGVTSVGNGGSLGRGGL